VSTPIRFDRTPYTVTYYQDGEKKTIRRVPPPKIHDALPTDKVELNTKRNDDFVDGGVYRVKNINPRHPNTLQLEDEEGRTTWINNHEMELKEKVAPREGEENLPSYDIPRRNRYLLWP
jgi:hypothetical protein